MGDDSRDARPGAGDQALAHTQAHERLRLVQQAGRVGALDWDLVTGEVWRSEEYCRVHGMPLAAAGARRHDPEWWRRIHPDDQAAVLDWHHRTLETVGPFETCYRIVRPDGAVRWVTNRGEVQAGPGGAPARLLSIHIDITDQRSMADQAAVQAAELSAIYGSAPIGLCVLDRELRWRRINDRLAEINGVPAADHIGRRVDEVLPELGPSVMPLMQQVLAGEPVMGIELEGETPARPGEIRSWRESWVPMRDAAGDVTGIIVAAEETTEERARQRELARREALLAAVGASVPDLIYAKDCEGRLLYANPATLALLGKPAEAVLGQPPEIYLADPADAPEIRANDAAVMQAGHPVTMDEHVTAPDGRRQTFESTKAPLRDADGSVIGLVGVTVDVTARRRREAHQALLFDLSDRLRGGPDAIDAAMAALGNELQAYRTGFVGGNADGRPAILHEWRRPEARSVNLPDRVEGFGLTGLAMLQQGRTLVIRDRAELPADAVPAIAHMPLQALIAVPLLRGTRLAAALFVSADRPRDWAADEVALAEEVAARLWTALERDRAERALRQLNAELEARVAQATAERNRLWALTDDLFVTSDFTGSTLAVSDSWERVLGLSRARLLTDPFEQVIHPDDWAGVVASLERLRRQGGSIAYENRVRAGDGSWHDIAWTLAAEPAGHVFHGVGRDVTAERAQARQLAATQAQLHEMQKLETIGQLTGGVAHDFNNLLTPIIAALDMVQRRLDDPRTRRVVDAGLQAAERARMLIERLLSFARRQVLLPRAVPPEALLDGLRQLIVPLIGTSITVEVTAPPGLPCVLVDPNQLELAILNLAVNARDAMPGGGRLTIGAAAVELTGPRADGLAGRFVRFDIADTGEGMDAATLERAVEPFFTTKPLGQGTGLGLSMVHGMAAQSGGALQIESAPGRGTVARIWLPATDAAPPADAVVTTTAFGPATLLLVDDEALVRTAVAEGLRSLGFDVTEAASGTEALQRLAERMFDVVITDEAMPRMPGSELARRIAGGWPGLPVLLISGDPGTHPPDSGVAVMTKPFRTTELAARIGSLLGR